MELRQVEELFFNTSTSLSSALGCFRACLSEMEAESQVQQLLVSTRVSPYLSFQYGLLTLTFCLTSYFIISRQLYSKGIYETFVV